MSVCSDAVILYLHGVLERCPARAQDYNWYSVPEQIESVRKLMGECDFLHVLPGHGRPGHMRDAAHRLQLLHGLLQEQGAL